MARMRIREGRTERQVCRTRVERSQREILFEISFSTKEYSNIKLSAAVGDDFNAHSIVNAEYSIDGQTYTKFGTYTLPYRAWAEGEFDLPADAAGQDRVYIRFMPDWTSELVGSESNLDGTAVAEIFVLADRNIVDDGEAPKLVSTLPADKAKDVRPTVL